MEWHYKEEYPDNDNDDSTDDEGDYVNEDYIYNKKVQVKQEKGWTKWKHHLQSNYNNAYCVRRLIRVAYSMSAMSHLLDESISNAIIQLQQQQEQDEQEKKKKTEKR
jgi:hypothetical protein